MTSQLTRIPLVEIEDCNAQKRVLIFHVCTSYKRATYIHSTSAHITSIHKSMRKRHINMQRYRDSLSLSVYPHKNLLPNLA